MLEMVSNKKGRYEGMSMVKASNVEVEIYGARVTTL